MELRKKLAMFLMDCASRLSWDGFVEYVCDYGEFGYCPDCEQTYNPEGRCR